MLENVWPVNSRKSLAEGNCKGTKEHSTSGPTVTMPQARKHGIRRNGDQGQPKEFFCLVRLNQLIAVGHR